MRSLLLIALLMAPTRANDAQLRRMLHDPLLWGPDFARVLNSLPAFESAGLRRVAILPYDVVSVRKFERRKQATAAATIATRALRAAARRTDGRTLPAIGVVVSPIDRALRVGTPVEDDSYQYLADDVRIEQIVQRFGKAERVRKEILRSETDRPAIELTLYEYAGGAIAVVTQQTSLVTRVYIDARAVMRAMSEGR